MTQTTKRKRLDQILIEQGLITPEHATEALMRQKATGNKFGSQLLYYRYIDEAALVKALSLQLQCEGIILSRLEIPEEVIQMIPVKQIQARRIIPFEYDQKTNTLKIACEDPTDTRLINDVNYIVQGKFVKLYVAAELAIETAIKKYVLGQQTSLNEKLSLELPDLIAEDDRGSLGETANKTLTRPESKAILFITDEDYSGSLFQTILSRDDYQTTICESLEHAANLVQDNNYGSIFIKSSFAENAGEFISSVRKKSPRTRIKKFRKSSDLVLGDESFQTAGEIIERNLVLLTSLLSSKDELPNNHSGIVGRYTDKLCRKLGIPIEDHLPIINAAYLHDIARHYYPDIEGQDYKQRISLSARLLESLGYSPTVIAIINSMYKEIDAGHRNALPLDFLGGNIITIVDLFCENIHLDQKLTLERLDAVKKKLRDLSGKLFLEEVVEAFIAMMQEEILNLHTTTNIGQVFIYSSSQEHAYPLELRLKNEGYRTISENSIDSAIDLIKRGRPDILILAVDGEAAKINSHIDRIVENEIDLTKITTFVLAEKEITSSLTSLYDKGIEDVIPLSANTDLLLMKLKKIMNHKQTHNSESGADGPAGGARGRLADMNLIDLMQALAPGRKTARITIMANEPAGNELMIYLDKGNIIYAKSNVNIGAEAIYEGMTWTDGKWHVEPIPESLLPEPNNKLSNDAILMEGAYQLDEKIRAGKL